MFGFVPKRLLLNETLRKKIILQWFSFNEELINNMEIKMKSQLLTTYNIRNINVFVLKKERNLERKKNVD